jgi:phosphoribosyl 1,2-cyclic phosphodiesterase
MRRALQLGVNGYIIKPLVFDLFVDEVMEIVEDKMVVQFWGVRGTLPVPGKHSTHFGGNTNCVTLSLAAKDGKELFIFDAGTGIKALSNHLMQQNKFPLSAKIFISHPHWDHINGIPFFVPLYLKGNEFEFLGSDHSDITFEKLISDQMSSVYFPITLNEFSAKVNFRSLTEGTFHIGDIEVQTLLLTHPGRCLGYRIQYKNKVFCYISDNELYLEDSPSYSQFEVDRLIHFIHKADLVVIDSTYRDDEYLKKINWGHSSISRVIDVVDKAKVKKVCLYHHDPDQFDADIKMKLKQGKAMLKARHSKTRCLAPCEGDKIFI